MAADAVLSSRRGVGYLGRGVGNHPQEATIKSRKGREMTEIAAIVGAILGGAVTVAALAYNHSKRSKRN